MGFRVLDIISILQAQGRWNFLRARIGGQAWRFENKYSNQNIKLKVGEKEAKLGHKAQNIFNIIQDTYQAHFYFYLVASGDKEGGSGKIGEWD